MEDEIIEQVTNMNVTHKFKVNSRKDPKIQYLIHIFDDDSINCSCKGYLYRNSCAHVNYIENNRNAVMAKIDKHNTHTSPLTTEKIRAKIELENE